MPSCQMPACVATSVKSGLHPLGSLDTALGKEVHADQHPSWVSETLRDHLSPRAKWLDSCFFS